MSESNPSPARVIDDYFAAIRAADADAWCACFAPDAIVHDPAGAPARIGEAAHRAFFTTFAAAFDRLDFVPERVFIDGAQAGVYFRAACTARNGATCEADGIDLFEFGADGRIVRLTAYWDPSPLVVLMQASS